MSEQTEADAGKREAFDEDIRRRNLIGYWMLPGTSTVYREPEPKHGPFKWTWQDIEEPLLKAPEHIPKEESFRRFIGFQHPDLEVGTTPNLILGAQMVLPGEVAPCHRHTMDAVRFVIEGDASMCTVMEGEEFPMHPGDFITTPNWCWHEHVNSGDKAAIWLDGAVAPLIQHFKIGFAEPHQRGRQDMLRPRGWSDRQFGPLKPRKASVSATSFRPPYRYGWAETRAALDELSGGPEDANDGVCLSYSDPVTGGPTLPTISCEIQLLAPKKSYGRHRHTHAAIYHVFEGEGATTIGEERFDWQKGDTFAVPLWTWHAHENTTAKPAILFSINDQPVMQSLGFWRQEQGS